MMMMMMMMIVFQLRKAHDKEITCVSWPKGKMLSSGWNRQIVMHVDRVDIVRTSLLIVGLTCWAGGDIRHTCSRAGGSTFNPLIATIKPQSNGPSYSDTVIGTLAVDG